MNIKKLISKLDNLNLINLSNITENNILLKKNIEKIEGGPFISEKIVDYINNILKYKYILSYKYKNIKIVVHYFCKKKIRNIKKLFELIINRIIFMMNITDVYKDVNMYIYDTPYKKKLPCKMMHKCKKNLTVNEINTGYSWSNNIVIYRKEELLKLIIHEMIHLLDIDIKYETGRIKKEFLKSLCIETLDILINESYVETWAIIIHMYISLLEQNKYNYKNYKKYFKKTLKFNFEQILKILIFYDVEDFNDLFKKNNKCNRIIQFKMNLFSYHILKVLNLININKFINNYSEKTNKYIIKKSYDFDEYIKYLKANLNNMSDIINKNIKVFKQKKYNLSLKMSLK